MTAPATVRLAAAKVGDAILVHDSGSYGVVNASTVTKATPCWLWTNLGKFNRKSGYHVNQYSAYTAIDHDSPR